MCALYGFIMSLPYSACSPAVFVLGTMAKNIAFDPSIPLSSSHAPVGAVVPSLGDPQGRGHPVFMALTCSKSKEIRGAKREIGEMH